MVLFDPHKEPHLYQMFNPVFAKTHKLVSSATEISFANGNLWESSSEEYNDDDNVKLNQNVDSDLHDIDVEDMQSEKVEQEVRQAVKLPLRKKLQVVLPPH